MPDLHPLHVAIVNGDATTARSMAEIALAENTDPLVLVTHYMAPAMDEVGRRFECSEFFVPELLLSARAMKAAMELVRPFLAARGTEPVGRVVVGTVKGDLHDIGKNLVASMLEGGGFEVFDLGVNVSPDRFVNAVRERNAHILAMSALLTTTMMSMKTTIQAFIEAGMRNRVKVVVGGAPVSKAFADEIGADGYGGNAVEAVSLARAVLGISVRA